MCSSEPAPAGWAPARRAPSGRAPSCRGLAGRARQAAGERGYVTAEAAVVLPALVLFTAMLLWAVMAAAARSEPEPRVRAAALSAAPRGARVDLTRSGDLVRVRVTARALGPGPLAGVLSAQLGAEATALAEDTVAGEAP